MRIPLLIGMLLLFVASGFGQDDPYPDIKAGIEGNAHGYGLFKLAKHTDWPDMPDDTTTTFNFGLLGSDTGTIKIWKSFGFAEKFRRIDKKPIRGLLLDDFDQIDHLKVLFVWNTGEFDIDEVRQRIGTKPILLVTVGYDFDKTMVNVIDDDKLFGRFDVNLTAMRKSGLKPDRMMKRFSHRSDESITDASSLLELMEDSVDFELHSEDLKLVMEEYREKVEEIELQEQEIAAQLDELEGLLAEVDNQRQLIRDQKASLREREGQIQQSRSKLDALLAESEQQEAELAATHAELVAEKERLGMIHQSMERERDMYQDQQKTLQAELEEQEALIRKKKQLLADTEKQIATQKDQIEEKEEAIQEREWLIAAGFLMLIALVGLAVLIYRNYRNKKKAHAEVESRNVIIEQQKELVEEKNKEVMDSIVYAKRLQQAILPPLEQFAQHFEDSFVLYLPKDIVAGDFYWMHQDEDQLFFAAADCTGHGVPGAMVSVVCSNALNRTVKEFGKTDAGKVLDMTREIVIDTFQKSGHDVKDGMDISLSVLDKQGKTLFWAGANNPLWIIRSKDIPDTGLESRCLNTQIPDQVGTESAESKDTIPIKPIPSTWDDAKYELLEVKADKQPIGDFAMMQPFTSHELTLESGDQLYMMTDGYQDQFGGHKGKKFKSGRLKKLLIDLADKPFSEQHQSLERSFEEWRGELEQIDDVCIIGVRV